MSCDSRPSLRKHLESAAGGSQVVAYLTLGDPPDRFLEIADEVLQAGALTLELGFPHPSPREGATLLDSHRRALDAGTDTAKAMQLLSQLAANHPQTPLIAVVQWPAIEDESQQSGFLASLSQAGAAAVLPIDIPLGNLSAFARQAAAYNLETVLSCSPNTPQRLRRIALKHCTGCIYVPRAQATGSEEVADTKQFCEQLAAETNLPILVGFGVDTPKDVANICAAKATAAAVGSSLVKRIAAGESAGGYVSQLLESQQSQK